jgi:hypothetical protein
MDTNNRPFPIGSTVIIGTKYEMADHPPFVGRGRQVADEWTGRKMMVTGYSKEGAVFLGEEPEDLDLMVDARRLSLAK